MMAASAVLTAAPRMRGAPLCVRKRPNYHLNCTSVRAQSEDEEAEHTLTRPGSKSSVRLFGVTHMSVSSRCAEFILKAKPPTVVVETAIDDEHGAETGNAVSSKRFSQMESDVMRGIRGLAHMLSQEAGSSDCADWPARAPTWRELREQVPPEQLAYIAAMGTGSLVVYGDLPKSEVVGRFARMPLAELDRSYGYYSSLNYAETALACPALPDESRARLEQAAHRVRAAMRACGTERVLIGERDEALCRSLLDALSKAPEGSTVVGVVGASHAPGILDWWGRLTSSEGASSSSSSTSSSTTAAAAAAAPSTPASSSLVEETGVRRALLERALVVRGSADIAEMVDELLGPLPEPSWDAYKNAVEIYGNSRMLMAASEDDVLPEVACARPKGTPLQQMIGPLRAVRPVNGGRGFTPELAEALRLLPVANDFFEQQAAGG